MSLFIDFQKLEIPGLILLCQLTPLESERVYFTNNDSGVVFDGVPYQPIEFKLSGVKHNSQGEFSTANMVISDYDNYVSNLIEDDEDHLEGSTLEIYYTRDVYLDNGETPDTSAIQLIDEYKISQIKEMVVGVAVNVVLSPMDWLKADVGRLALPKCIIDYRGQFCRYTGRMYDIMNNPTNDPKLDDCNGSLTSCKIRHGNIPLPFKGFPQIRS